MEKKFVKNQVVTCITTSMNWIAFNSLWGGMPETVTMTGGNVAHEGEHFGDEDDMIFCQYGIF